MDTAEELEAEVLAKHLLKLTVNGPARTAFLQEGYIDIESLLGEAKQEGK